MNLEQCYEDLEGSYEDVKKRLPSDELILRFLLKFLADPGYGSLCQAMEQENDEEAFKAVHTLKGVCQNLSFDKLSQSASALTEVLRSWQAGNIDRTESEKLFQQVFEDYDQVIRVIKGLQE